MWADSRMTKIMYACLIMHNMMVEQNGRNICKLHENDELNPPQLFNVGSPEFLQRVADITTSETCYALREDLATHLQLNNV